MRGRRQSFRDGGRGRIGRRGSTDLLASGSGARRRVRVRQVSPDTSGRERDANGCLLFDDEPDFRPNLSPQQMIASGIFGGCYQSVRGKKGIGTRGRIPIDHREYPDEWFCDLPASMYVSKRYDVSTNRYKVSRVNWFLWRRHVIDDSSLTLRLRRQQQQR